MPGQLYRSADGLTDFELGPRLFRPEMRHSALLKRGDALHVFWSRVGDAPEVLLRSTIDLSGPWKTWRESEPVEVLRPCVAGHRTDRRPGLCRVASSRHDALSELAEP